MPPRAPLLRLARRPFLPNASSLRRCYATTTSTTGSGGGGEGSVVQVSNIPAPGSGHIRILKLNRPAAMNAISRELLYSLRNEVDDVHSQYDASTGDELPVKSWNKRFGGAAGEDEKGPTRAVILASAMDRCFCAGADLKERRGFTPEE